MTYLLFIKRLDEIQTQKESKARITEMPINAPIYQSEEYNLRWNRFKELDPQVMFDLFTRTKSPEGKHEKGVFEFLKNIGGRAQAFSKYIKGATFMIPMPRG